MKEKKKQVAEGGSKSQRSRGRTLKETKTSTTDDEGRKLARLIYRALHDISGETGEMDEAQNADCSALRPLALKMAKVYNPCALVVKKTGFVEGVGDTHGMRPRRKGDIADWLMRVLYLLGYGDHGPLAYAGVVALHDKYEWPDVGWNCQMAWMGGCGLKQNLGGTKPIAPEMLVAPNLLGLLFK